FKKIKEQPFIIFLLIAFLANFMIYLISPGARIRYTYMFFPMAVSILAYPLYLQIEDKNWQNKVYHSFFQVLMPIFAIGCIALPFIEYFHVLPFISYSGPIFGLLILIVF